MSVRIGAREAVTHTVCALLEDNKDTVSTPISYAPAAPSPVLTCNNVITGQGRGR